MALFFKDITKQEYCEKCDAYSSTLHTCVIKPELCLVEEIPIPHGRLIDADALLEEAKRISGPETGDGWDNYGVYALIKRQPTVMEAEEEE